MAYNRTQLKDRVAQRIDEVLPTGNTEIQSIVEGSYDLIDDELDEAARMTLTNAPLSLVFPAASNDVAAGISIDATTLVATITCPADFLRFIRLQLNNTERPVSNLYPIDNPMYNRVWNKSNAGHYQRPMGFLTPGTTGSKYKIEVFRAKTDSDTLSEFMYVPDTVAESVPEDLQDAVIDYTAYRVLLANKYPNEAKLAYEAYTQVMMSVKKGLVGE